MNLPKQNKHTVGGTWRLLQYSQMPDKNSRYIMEYLEFFMVFQYFYYISIISCRNLIAKHCFMNFLMIWLKTEVASIVEMNKMLHVCHAVPLLISPAVQDAR